MSNCFWAQVYVTSLDIGFNIFSETWLIVFPADEVFGFIYTKMSYQIVIVVLTDELCLNDFKYKW